MLHLGCSGREFESHHLYLYKLKKIITDAETLLMVGATSLMVIPKIIPGVTTLFAYSKYSQTEAGRANTSRGANMDGASEIMADFKYNFTKEMSARLQLAQVDLDSEKAGWDDNITIGKLYLIYSF